MIEKNFCVPGNVVSLCEPFRLDENGMLWTHAIIAYLVPKKRKNPLVGCYVFEGLTGVLYIADDRPGQPGVFEFGLNELEPFHQATEFEYDRKFEESEAVLNGK